jgi:hypothetical protein
MFFDRMTQSVYFDYEDCKDFLNVNPQREVSIIDIIGGGIKTFKRQIKALVLL